jgi:hypothetical protein
MISGCGTFHTDKCGDEYSVISFDDVVNKAKNPPSVAKAEAQWLIASSFESRSAKAQQANGVYHVLWADFDDHPVPMDKLARSLKTGLLTECEFLMYTSKSATADIQKSRLVIPLKKAANWSDWWVYQQVLNDELDAIGAKTDRVSERAAQLCYMPNEGRFYAFAHAKGERIAPGSVFAKAIKVKELKHKAAHEEVLLKLADSKKKREQRLKAGFNSLIDAFNATYEVEEILLQAGYAQQGESFSHPESASGSFSASIKDRRVHSLSSSDPLYKGGGGVGAHDAFGAFCVLFHSNDEKAALTDAGDTWLAIDGEPWNKVQQREYMKRETVKISKSGKSTLEFLTSLSATGKSGELENQMLSDVFVLDDIAILGQWTAIFASPGSGKTLITLYLLADAISQARINGSNVFYVNVDDSFKGGVEKTRFAEKHGFHMLLPGVSGFQKNAVLEILEGLIAEDSARGQVVVMDTLKKFVDTMDKKSSSKFGDLARQFVASGGTMICLSHTNKNKGADGKSTYGGTSDIVDDADCAFTIEMVEERSISSLSSTFQVEFNNIKNRGDVALTAGFSWLRTKGMGYDSLLGSVKRLDQGAIKEAKYQAEMHAQQEKDSRVIKSVVSLLMAVPSSGKTDIVDHVHGETGESKPKVIKVLERWNGEDYETQGHLWRATKGSKNFVGYELIKSRLDRLVSGDQVLRG